MLEAVVSFVDFLSDLSELFEDFLDRVGRGETSKNVSNSVVCVVFVVVAKPSFLRMIFLRKFDDLTILTTMKELRTIIMTYEITSIAILQ